MELSVITANLLALPRFLRSLQTGHTGAHVTTAELEMSNMTASAKSSDRATARKHASVREARKRREPSDRDAQSENDSETGILRVVDVRVEAESRDGSAAGIQ